MYVQIIRGSKKRASYSMCPVNYSCYKAVIVSTIFGGMKGKRS